MRKPKGLTFTHLAVISIIALSLASVAAAAYTQKALYLDGTLVEDTNEGTTAGLAFGTHIIIGAEGATTVNLYNEYIGALDEFAVYAGMLSSARITAHWNARGNYANYQAAVAADNPLLWLQFEDASVANGATASNSGSSSTDGSYFQSGGTAMSQVTGISGGADKALNIPDSVDDTGGHAVDVPNNGEFGDDLEGDVTVEVWVKFTDFNSMPDNDYLRFFSNAGGYGVMVADPNELGVMGGDITNYMGLANDVNNEAWHHVVVTYDSHYEANVPPPGGTYTEEVAADNPVLWIRFEDQDPCDYSGNGYWVDYGSVTSIVEKAGGMGKSVLLDTGGEGEGLFAAAATNGPNEPCFVDYNDGYAFAPNDITVEMWYKTLPTGQPQPHDYGIFLQQIGPYTNEPCAPAVSNAAGQIRVFGGSDAWYTGVNPGFNQKWHHMVVTYDEEPNGTPNQMYAQLYLDGILKGANNFTGTKARLGPELSHMVFGAENDMGYSYNVIPGYYDEIAIYEGILDPNRVLAHYAAWQVKDCAELQERGPLPAYAVIDSDKDCNIDFYDFAYFAQEWALCNDPNSPDPNCVPNW